MRSNDHSCYWSCHCWSLSPLAPSRSAVPFRSTWDTLGIPTPGSSVSPVVSTVESAAVPLAASPTVAGSESASTSTRGSLRSGPRSEQGCSPCSNGWKRSKAFVILLFKAGAGFESVLMIAARIGGLFSVRVSFGFGALDCLLCFEIWIGTLFLLRFHKLTSDQSACLQRCLSFCL